MKTWTDNSKSTTDYWASQSMRQDVRGAEIGAGRKSSERSGAGGRWAGTVQRAVMAAQNPLEAPNWLLLWVIFFAAKMAAFNF